MAQPKIVLRHVKVHNLKSVSLELQPQQLILFTGVSGSGKSSMAFDTLFIEGQRRYVESLSAQARRQMTELTKPDLDHSSGVTPTISIEQKSVGRNPRSTVGTLTEIYDYLRVLYARVGVPHCPVSGEAVAPQSRERIIKTAQTLPCGKKILVMAPYARDKKGEFKEEFKDLLRKGFTRARVDGKMVMLDDEPALAGHTAHNIDLVIDRIALAPQEFSRLAEAITQALEAGGGNCLIVDGDSGEELFFSMHAFSPLSGLSYGALEPQDFSFNSPAGMCERCNGLGVVMEFDEEKVIDPAKSIAEDCCRVASSYSTVRYGNIYDNLARLYGFSVHTPWQQLPAEARRVFLHGTEKKWTRMTFVHPVTGACWNDHVQWKGVFHEAQRRYQEAQSTLYRSKVEELMTQQQCPVCRGSRLKAYPSACLLAGQRIASLTAMTVEEGVAFFEGLALPPQETLLAGELLKEIKERLLFLKQVGLGYLTLDRTAPTLSGGEAQRVRLASQIGCGLVGITYVLDEPSIGLHPRDNKRLIATLQRLRDLGNTVVVVEHDEETILAADYIVDFGPGAGQRGGEIVVEGPPSKVLASKTSLTASYLVGTTSIALPKRRRRSTKQKLTVKGASHHNLKGIDVAIPLGLFVAVTGVSGSGKSSLVSEILYPLLNNRLHGSRLPVGRHREVEGLEHLDKVIAVDQSPIGRNPRSNPATYIKLLDDIRDLFAKLPESLARGYKKGRFSFNVKEGSCPQCEGMGLVKVDMDFMEDAWVECSSCQGKRFDSETLAVFFKGKNIYDILEMEVDEAAVFFQNVPSIHHKLQTLQQVGMGYIKLGQSSTTLSGGEAQRVKLAKELVRPASGRTLYIFDEPTTGLHFHDVKQLLEVLHKLVDHGNTVVVIEHNMEVVKTADWVIDLGPEGGAAGGQLVAAGTPEQVVKQQTLTGLSLQEAIDGTLQQKARSLLQTKRRTPKRAAAEAVTAITIEGAEQNNLKHLDVTLPRQQMTVFSGPSGSGKSSLAFETIYAEGQRRYSESLSPYARQFVKQMPKPKVARVEGLSPAIAIEQKVHAGNPRSTVGTMTEIYDYLRLLYARLGVPHCPETGEVITAISKEHIIERVMALPAGEKIQVLAPLDMKRGQGLAELVRRYQGMGFLRLRLDGTVYDLGDEALMQAYDAKRRQQLALVVDRLVVGEGIRHRLAEAVAAAGTLSQNQVIVMRPGEDLSFNLSFAVLSTGKSYPPIVPQTFAFNHALGMCLDCLGLGYQYGAQLAAIGDIASLTGAELLQMLWPAAPGRQPLSMLHHVCHEEGIDLHQPLKSLPPAQQQLLMNGSEERWYDSGHGFHYRWRGINHVLAKVGRSGAAALREQVTPLLEEHPCPSCGGARLNPLARHVTIDGHSIVDLCGMPLQRAHDVINAITLPKMEQKVLGEVIKQLLARLQFLCDVGLHYLSLDRKAPSLSGGETQRIRLARQLGTALTGVLYVLDEPTIGLHPRDNDKLIGALHKLKELGNTLLLVEHDPLTIAHADYVLDFGPQAGQRGGYVTARGTYRQILSDPHSLTGQYISGAKAIAPPPQRRHGKKGQQTLTVRGANEHNLKGIDVEIPLGRMVCLTGVSGSGKSTLMHDVLLQALRKEIGSPQPIHYNGATIEGADKLERVVAVDQNPIGLTSRSDVATYCEVLTPLRELFAKMPQALMRGLQPKHFSYNHRAGMCTACWGLGYKKVEMHFLPPVRVQCEGCQGLRLNPLSLEVLYQERNLGQWLQVTVAEARHAFANHRRITRILDTLIEVGLGYLTLGQEMATLSGGEAQRIKLSRELSKRGLGTTLYLLDEPTTGLHFDDIAKLLGLLHKLVDKGHSLLIIEHNLEVLRHADWIIDLGPDAGDAGGEVVCVGTPEQVAHNDASWTGRYLKEILNKGAMPLEPDQRQGRRRRKSQ